MAEVLLGHVAGAEDQVKKVVIKKILPHRADDERYVKMFLDEARIAARFNHPNLVQIYELAEIDSQYCIVMEYIEGQDLDGILAACAKLRQRIPVDIAAVIVAEAAAGLHYAHELCNDAGEPLNLVHRDVSPSNIIVTWQGGIKVVDFGIAKHKESSTRTQTGVLKGKLSYMSPEQALGKKVDRRSDVFSLGSVLYELITSICCFDRGRSFETLDAVVSAVYRPARDYRSDLPKSLERILQRMLAHRPDDRFATALEASRELQRFLTETRRPAGDDIKGFLNSLFDRTAIVPIRGYTAVSSEPIADEAKPAPATADAGLFLDETMRQQSDSGVGNAPGLAVPVPPPGGLSAPQLEESTLRQAPAAEATVRQSYEEIVARDARHGLESEPTRRARPPGADETLREVPSLPPASRGDREDQPTVRAAPLVTPVRPVVATSIRPSASPEIGSAEAGLPPPPFSSRPRPPRRPSEIFTGATYLVRRIAVRPASSLGPLLGFVGALLLLPAVYWFVIRPAQEGTRVADAAGVGRDRGGPSVVHVVPPPALQDLAAAVDSGAEVALDAGIGVGSDGDDSVGDLFGEVELADQEPGIGGGNPNRPVRPRKRTGTLSITSDPPAEVLVGGRRIGVTPLRDYSLQAGSHTIQLRDNRFGLNRSLTLNIRPGERVTKELVFKKGKVVVDVKPWAEVFWRGKKIGMTPLPPFELYEGNHELRLRNPELGVERTVPIAVRPGEVTKVVERF